MVSEDLKMKIKKHFKNGHSYKMIHYLLLKNNGYNISYSYLKRKVIPSLGLRRRELQIDENYVVRYAMKEIENGLGGAEQLRQTLLKKYNVLIPRDVARELTQILDPEGISRRRRRRLRRRQYMYISKGPDFLWHLDGYDKLSQFGLCIHGCIDGFSRKIIWLEVGPTNKRPEVVLQYYIRALKQGGFPRLIRGDRGTENKMVQEVQDNLTRAVRGEENAKGFIYGKSTANQRIERFWGILRQKRSDFWIDHFKTLQGHDKDNVIHRLCLQYSYLPYIKAQLNEIRECYNTHLIRQQRNGDTVSGVPDLLHSCPEIWGTRSYRTSMTSQNLNDIQGICVNNFNQLDEDFIKVAMFIISEHSLYRPEELTDIQMCKELYLNLRAVMVTII